MPDRGTLVLVAIFASCGCGSKTGPGGTPDSGSGTADGGAYWAVGSGTLTGWGCTLPPEYLYLDCNGGLLDCAASDPGAYILFVGASANQCAAGSQNNVCFAAVSCPGLTNTTLSCDLFPPSRVAGTYDLSGNSDCGFNFTGGANDCFQYTAGNGSGQISLTLSSSATAVSTGPGNGGEYLAHGTLTATMDAVSEPCNGPGSMTLTINF